jgi:hypothetical protein
MKTLLTGYNLAAVFYYNLRFFKFVLVFYLQAKVLVAEQTEKDIDQTRSQYIPVAVITQILFFCVSDMGNIDPMYQYSLEWFVTIFLGGISQAERAGNCCLALLTPCSISLMNFIFCFTIPGKLDMLIYHEL